MKTETFKSIFKDLYPESDTEIVSKMYKICTSMDSYAHLVPTKRKIRDFASTDIESMTREEFREFTLTLLRVDGTYESKLSPIYNSDRFLNKFKELYPSTVNGLNQKEIRDVILSLEDRLDQPKATKLPFKLEEVEESTEEEAIQWIEHLKSSGLRSDHWAQETKAKNRPVYKFLVNLVASRGLTKFTEAIYQVERGMSAATPCRVCGKSTKFRAYNLGYSKYCCFECSTKDAENYTDRGKSIRKTSISKIEGSGEYCYINSIYDNMNSAHRRFKFSGNIAKTFASLEEFDSIVPFYDWVPNTDLKQRLWYFESGLTSPRTCKLCDSLTTSYTSNYCRNHHQMHDPDVKNAIVDTNIEKYGVQYPSQRQEHKEALKEAFPDRVGFVCSSAIADNIFLESLRVLGEHGIVFDDSDIYLNNYTKEFFLRDGDKFFSYDFTIRSIGLIVEYNGEHVHPNPKLSEAEWSAWKSAFGKESADVVYQKDQLKISTASRNGFKVVQLWSSMSFEDCVNGVVDGVKYLRNYHQGINLNAN